MDWNFVFILIISCIGVTISVKTPQKVLAATTDNELIEVVEVNKTSGEVKLTTSDNDL